MKLDRVRLSKAAASSSTARRSLGKLTLIRVKPVELLGTGIVDLNVCHNMARVACYDVRQLKNTSGHIMI